MQFLLLFSLLASINASILNITWGKYLEMFPNVRINALSKFHFGENLRWILEQNKLNHTYELGLTPFLHLSDSEWSSKFYNITFDEYKSEIVHVSNLQSTPNSLSWVDKGVTTPVKDQQMCGSCYSFSATETVETAYAIKSGQLKILSPQQVVDCSKLNAGCNGGLQSRVYKYLQNTGQCLDVDYPYTAKDGTCHSCKAAIPTLKSYVSVKTDEKEMANALTVNSLAVAICASQKEFQTYKSGVMDFKCCTQLDHAVTIEGMGTENGKDYWLVRNSWGESWGEKGYVKMVRGTNLCGIKESVVYAIF